MCWGGTCVAQCTGSPEEPQCSDPCTACLISYEGLLNLCYLSCDPLAQECPGMDLCVANPMNPQLFICVIDASGEEGQLFDPCEYANACDPGLFCASPQMAVECDQGAAGCCLPFCDLTAPACPGAGQQCVPWSGDEPQPGCIQNVGMCRVP